MQEIHLYNTEKEADFWEMLKKFPGVVDREYVERSIERHQKGERLIFLAKAEEQYVGYTFLNFHPKYSYFRKQKIPEIQDLNVLQEFRRQGIGRALIEHCEGIAKQEGYEEIGIGVGLDISFGYAQRLYIKMGYIPDGEGVCYDRIPITPGEFRPIDDNLSLMMTKKL
ncbi:MAG: GNAT family N-acetyltransferase [Alphaproteobacteria bacterium]|nr:GNAT family N-acetyltransferase [Alphaproteobacteria bacterium]